ELGVAVALDDLRGHWRRLEIETPADVRFDARRKGRERADRARQLPDAYDLARAPHPGNIACRPRAPHPQLETQRPRVGVDPVRTADHRRAAVLLRARADRMHQAVEPLENQVAGLPHLDGLCRIDDVR